MLGCMLGDRIFWFRGRKYSRYETLQCARGRVRERERSDMRCEGRGELKQFRMGNPHTRIFIGAITYVQQVSFLRRLCTILELNIYMLELMFSTRNCSAVCIQLLPA
ncbi:hypothetical protein TRVL_07810 [Trypanosoma vivax]|nr:hypothetical protein TRVL_07810 [Trypanosoma vivax]